MNKIMGGRKNWKAALGLVALFLFVSGALVAPAWASEGAAYDLSGALNNDPDEIMIGSITLPVALTIALSMLFYVVPNVPNRIKPLIAVTFGIGLSFVGLLYVSGDMTFQNVVNSVVAGFVSGTSATGIHQLTKKTVVGNKAAKAGG